MTALKTILTAGQIAALVWLFIQAGQYVQGMMDGSPPDFWLFWASMWLNAILLLCIVDLRKGPKP